MSFALKHFNYFLILLFLGMPCVVNAEIHSPWEMEGVNERIKKIRMGPTKLHFVNTDGSRINQQLPVKINLEKHAFQFGVGWVRLGHSMVREISNGTVPIEVSPCCSISMVLIERREGSLRKLSISSNLKWAKARDISIKGRYYGITRSQDGWTPT